MKYDAQYAALVLSRLEKRYGTDIRTQLKNRNVRELFVAAFLSPQCTDKQVNRVTPALFRKFRSFDDYSRADTRTLMRYLSGLNYYKTKARHLKRSATIIIEKFHGKVPKTINELLELPGVGRKVANVILNEGYGIDEGIAVDTHCGRVAQRTGLSRHKEPHKIEQDLMHAYPKRQWGAVSNSLIELGRDVCHARNRECGKCVLKDICPSSLINS